MSPDTTISPRNAANHGIDSPAVKKKRVPTAAHSAQRQTTDDATNPPSDHWSRKGRTVIIAAWLVRRNR